MEIAGRWVESFEYLLNAEDPEETFNCIQEQLDKGRCETPTL